MKLRLWVPSEDVPEVDVEELAGLCDQEVVQVAVADAQEVGDDAVAGARLDVVAHHLSQKHTAVIIS